MPLPTAHRLLLHVGYKVHLPNNLWIHTIRSFRPDPHCATRCTITQIPPSYFIISSKNIRRLLDRAVLNTKKKVVPEPGNFKRARGQYMSSPRCSQLFNHESLAPNWSQHTTI